LAGPSGKRFDALEYASFRGLHSHGNTGVEDEGRLIELPPDLRFDGLPSQPTGVQHRRSTGEAKRTTGSGGAALTPRRTRGREPGGSRDGFTAVKPPVVPAVTHGSTHVALIPQIQYTCIRQDGWIKQPPIKFGGVKLTDAADPGYLGIRNCDDKVLNYEGVGSSISCRLNFPGKKIGSLKILTTNHKNIREPITKKKLASEVAKLVKRRIEMIRAEPGCHDIAFENVVLTRLIHVSRASWQPELWYEIPAPDFNASQNSGPPFVR